MSEPSPEAPEELGILSMTKKSLGVGEDDDSFDIEIAMHINSVFSDLTQLGIGPTEGFEIEDDATKWSDYLGSDKRFNSAKSYMYMRVRLLFDSPDNYFLVKSLEEQCTKAEFRLNVAREDLLMAGPVAPDIPGSATPVNLLLTAGLPYSRRIRVTGAANVWPTSDSFEVRSQIRLEQSVTSQLLGSLVPYITPSIEDEDILLDIEMTGQQAGGIPSGYYDIILSDPGTVDARAIPVVSGRVQVGTLTTAASDG